MEKMPITAAGLKALEDEIRHLKNVERPAIIAAIAQARALGDLSENAEYHAAREKQGFVEGRIKELEGKISIADVIDVSKLSGDKIMFGATVQVADEDDRKIIYQIVGEEEANIKAGKLSVTAPLSRALIGKKVGDYVEVNAPGGSKSYEILSVVYA